MQYIKKRTEQSFGCTSAVEMVAFSKLCLFGVFPAVYAHVGRADERASTFAGATTAFQFPPPGVTATVPDPNFPDGSVVGFPGPTPSSCLSHPSHVGYSHSSIHYVQLATRRSPSKRLRPFLRSRMSRPSSLPGPTAATARSSMSCAVGGISLPCSRFLPARGVCLTRPRLFQRGVL